MNIDLPALYKSADAASRDAQNEYLRLFAINGLALVLGSLFATTVSSWEHSSIAGMICFLASLGLFLSGQLRESRQRWYQARALAESVKTSTWRYLMRADPYDKGTTEEADSQFRRTLSELIKDNQSLGRSIADDSCDGDQVTTSMREIQQESYAVKKDLYQANRIKEQRSWYQGKARYNARRSRAYCLTICFAYVGLAVMMLIRIRYPDGFYPIAVLSVLTSVLIAWTQLKRFDELASAYALTAHEVGIIETRYGAVASEEDLSNFVADAENAFSREHTQWVARRDH